ncbi:hypothetical protein TIFTF001_040999 [Ficus carica]|uniref:Uncharacterized protein n=1 Tax=Ficus carica TaxID=3494 RepID=A0AA87Z285_FICCA|nr:hypothetical protein TIFTF001_040999 [Ficus carica]
MAETVFHALLSTTAEVLADGLLIPTAAAKLRKERDKEVERLKEELEFVKPTHASQARDPSSRDPSLRDFWAALLRPAIPARENLGPNSQPTPAQATNLLQPAYREFRVMFPAKPVRLVPTPAQAINFFQLDYRLSPLSLPA